MRGKGCFGLSTTSGWEGMLEPSDCFVPTALREEGVGGNRDYVDLRGHSWRTAESCLVNERMLLEELRRGGDEEAIRARFVYCNFLEHDEDEAAEMVDDDVDNAVYDAQMDLDDDGALFYLLDPGCVSAVAALSAAGCPPIYSCNGGRFGSRHHADEPIVAFYARARRRELLNTAAAEAGVILGMGANGIPVVSCEEPEGLLSFAERLVILRKTIKAPRMSPPKSSSKKQTVRTEQLRLL